MTTRNYINFTSANDGEKLDFVLALAEKHKDILNYAIDNASNPNFRVFLQFAAVVCNYGFSQRLFNSVKSEIYTKEELANLYIEIFDRYIFKNIEIDFLIVN